MENEKDKFDRQLRMMVLLAANNRMSVDDISQALGTSRRSIYRYLDAFIDMGFKVDKHGAKYSIDPASPFFLNITRNIHFTQDEARAILRVINSVADNSPEICNLRDRLSHLYETPRLVVRGAGHQLARNVSVIYRAIRMKRVVMFRNYTMPGGKMLATRIVEPYQLMEDDTELRCYDIDAGMNRTLIIGRTQKVEMIDMLWTNESRHVRCHTDLFGRSGEEQITVNVRLSPRATNVLVREYPSAEKFLSLRDDGSHVLHTTVADFKGIGRFVLGMAGEAEVLAPQELKDYLAARAADLLRQLKE